mmetsp:Transcript_66602/g.124292  ORF Transcript_66602/g.124292 Transcript_66602/m.124292 type:complete len:432 (-) Transcript_66602:48-1343(-)
MAASQAPPEARNQQADSRRLSNHAKARLEAGEAVPEVGASREWEEHTEWAQRLWRRMDRDGSGRIDHKELECEEFRSVMHRMLAPQAPRTTSYTGRAQINFKQAMLYCLRKADLNKDGVLSFEEFRAMLWTLRWPAGSEDASTLLFALFDVDGDQLINREEFRQMYRFYMGSDPTEEEFVHTWFEVSEGKPDVTRAEYVRWLRRTKNVVFKQAPTVRPRDQPQSQGKRGKAAAQSTEKSSLAYEALGETKELGLGSSASAPDIGLERSRKKKASAEKAKLPGSHPLARRRNSLYSVETRPRWNRSFGPQGKNEEIAVKSMRRYFSQPESLMALQKYYQKRPGFKQLEGNPIHAAQVKMPNAGEGITLRESHHKRGGRMRDPLTGKVVPWNDAWQSPPEVKYVPTIEYKALLQPPPWLWRSRFEYEADDEPF